MSSPPDSPTPFPMSLWSIGMPARPISLPLRPGLEFPERARAWKVWRETWTRPRMYAKPVIIEMLNRVDANDMGVTEFSVWLISTAGAKPKTSQILMKPCKTWRRVIERVKRLERQSLWFHYSPYIMPLSEDETINQNAWQKNPLKDKNTFS